MERRCEKEWCADRPSGPRGVSRELVDGERCKKGLCAERQCEKRQWTERPPGLHEVSRETIDGGAIDEETMNRETVDAEAMGVNVVWTA